MLKSVHYNCLFITLLLLLTLCTMLLLLLDPKTSNAFKGAIRTTTTEKTIKAQSEPTVPLYKFPRHLLYANSLLPDYMESKGRKDVRIVLGIPTVERKRGSYLKGTLYNLIENMSEEEQNETLIVVYIGTVVYDDIWNTFEEIRDSFEPHMQSGLIDIISPTYNYYPAYERPDASVTASLEIVSGFSKQNLDYAFLMAYAHGKGTYYVQLNDDIRTEPKYLTLMHQFAKVKSALMGPREPNWIILDFGQDDLIGKMFKTVELPYFITYIQMFYNDMPIQQLLEYFLETILCRQHKNARHCKHQMEKYWVHFHKSLFQHIGGSLKNKIRILNSIYLNKESSKHNASKHDANGVNVQKSNSVINSTLVTSLQSQRGT